MAMAGRHFGAVLRQIERLFVAGSVAGLSEGQLIERFATRRDEAAFEAIVARHGPMVLGICRRLLRDPDDVEDAFQATFLVLVRKAGTLRDRDLLGNWLFGVASRVALRARAVAARRCAIEGADAVEPPSEPAPEGDRESRAMLHEEVRGLPEKYRVPVVLCYLEGLTHEEAAHQLGWPVGTVKGRLARAREVLRRRLTRRGLTLSAGALAVSLARDARAAIPPALVESTIKAALSVAAGRALAAGAVAANVAALTEGVLKVMFWNKLKTAAVALVTAGIVTAGVGGWTYQAIGDNKGAPPSEARAQVVTREEPGQPAPEPTADDGPVSAVELEGLDQKAEETFSGLLDRTRKRSGRFDDLERLIRWSNHVLESQLDLTANETERRAALTAHHDRMRQLHELTQALPQSDPDQPAKADLARVQRQSAERRLKTAQGGGPTPNPGPAPGLAGAENGEAGKNIRGDVPDQSPPEIVVPDQPPPAVVVGEVPSSPVGEIGTVVPVIPQMGDIRVAPSSAEMEMDHRARIEIMKLAARVEARDKSPRTRKILAKLEEPVAMFFANPTPLKDVLKYIKAATTGPNDTGIPIYVDPAGLGEMSVTMASPVTIDLEGFPLKTTLQLILKQLRLAYCVHDGMLIISSVKQIAYELEEAEEAEEATASAQPVEPSPERSAPKAPANPPPATRAKPPAPHETAPAGPQPGATPNATAPEKPRPDPGRLKSEAIGKRLDAPARLSIARETPLSDVLQSIQKATRDPDGGEIQIYVDPAVREQLKSPAAFDLEGVPFRAILTLLLGRVGLNWDIQDGLLIVSTNRGLENYRRIASHFTFLFGQLDALFPSGQGEALAKFGMPISLSFPNPTPLGEVMKAIRDATKGPDEAGIPTFYGPPVPDGEGGFGTRTEEIEKLPVRIDVKDVPVRTCLALLLAPQGQTDIIYQPGQGPLDGRIIDGLLVIGGPEWVQSLHAPSGGFRGGMSGMGGMGAPGGMM